MGFHPNLRSAAARGTYRCSVHATDAAGNDTVNGEFEESAPIGYDR
jgi:hypothetical protein